MPLQQAGDSEWNTVAKQCIQVTRTVGHTPGTWIQASGSWFCVLCFKPRGWAPWTLHCLISVTKSKVTTKSTQRARGTPHELCPAGICWQSLSHGGGKHVERVTGWTFSPNALSGTWWESEAAHIVRTWLLSCGSFRKASKEETKLSRRHFYSFF